MAKRPKTNLKFALLYKAPDDTLKIRFISDRGNRDIHLSDEAPAQVDYKAPEVFTGKHFAIYMADMQRSRKNDMFMDFLCVYECSIDTDENSNNIVPAYFKLIVAKPRPLLFQLWDAILKTVKTQQLLNNIPDSTAIN